jgi:Domain of unknown function (DUF4388)
MQDLPGAVSLARALLALHRGRGTGVLHVCSGAEARRIAVVDGRVRAVACSRDRLSLGDVLLRSGDLDAQAHRRALTERPVQGAVGDWLVDSGLATRPAVEHALRRQLHARVLDVFRARGLEYTFQHGAADVGVPWVSESMATPDLVLSALRAAVQPTEAAARLAAVGERGLTLTGLGRGLLHEAALWPDEAAMCALLEAGEGVAKITHVTGGSPRVQATLAALLLLSGVRVDGSCEPSYPLLVRKRLQMRQGASPEALLDMPERSRTADTRRALRRLARALHPDALGPDAPVAVRCASADLMAALSRAEERLRAGAEPGRSG